MHIAGARVLVTGGARRLGRAIALGLAERGAQVAFTYHRSAADADVDGGGARGGRRGRPRHSPPISPTATRPGAPWRRRRPRSAASTSSCTRPPAASSRPIRMDVEPALFADAIGATLTGGFFCAQAARRAMGDAGVIVNITDVAALEAWPLFAPHAAAKAALAQLTRSLARAFAPEVRVCAVAPGPVLLPDGSDEATARAAGRRAPRSGGWDRPRTSWEPSHS